MYISQKNCGKIDAPTGILSLVSGSNIRLAPNQYSDNILFGLPKTSLSSTWIEAKKLENAVTGVLADLSSFCYRGLFVPLVPFYTNGDVERNVYVHADLNVRIHLTHSVSCHGGVSPGRREHRSVRLRHHPWFMLCLLLVSSVRTVTEQRAPFLQMGDTERTRSVVSSEAAAEITFPYSIWIILLWYFALSILPRTYRNWRTRSLS